jgi:hypothetical protein
MAYATWQVRGVRESIGKYDIDTDSPEERKRLELLHRYLRQHTRNLEKARAELREQQTVRQTKAELSPDLLTGMPTLLDYAKVARRTRAADKAHLSSDIAAYVAKASDLTPEEKAILENIRQRVAAVNPPKKERINQKIPVESNSTPALIAQRVSRSPTNPPFSPSTVHWSRG